MDEQNESPVESTTVEKQRILHINLNGDWKEVVLKQVSSKDDAGNRKLSAEKIVVLFLTPVVLALAIFGYIRFGTDWTPHVFRKLFDNLPVALPILTLLLSVLLSPQDLLTQRGILRLSNPLSLGFVNFAIWYLVTSQSSIRFIKINDHSVLMTDYAVVVFIVAFTWAGFCSVTTALAETALRRRALWFLVQFALFVISVAMLRLPIGLLEQRATVEKQLGVSLDVRNFTVNIPFRDPSLNAHLGRTSDPLDESAIYRHIPAKTAAEAREKALTQFRDSELSNQFQPPKGKNKEPKTVEILEYGVVAQEEVN
jgi:hypothetical protein